MLLTLRKRIGMLFQSGALLTDLSVFDNVAFPLREHTDLPQRLIRTLVLMKLRPPFFYRWTSYRVNALGRFSPLLSSHPVYLVLGAADNPRRGAYRSLFRPHLDPETISDLRLALIP